MSLSNGSRFGFLLAYQSIVAAKRAKGLNLSAHQYGKFATMAMADHEMLEIRREVEELRSEMKDHFRLLREVLNHALYEEAC